MDEFELTYLPKELPAGLAQAQAKEMLDIYIPASLEHPYLRIRKSGSVYEITNKRPAVAGDSSHQIEHTISLSEEEYNDLSIVPGKRVVKTRYLYLENGRLYEVDVFKGDLEGLVLVDVEFNSSGEKAAFVPPHWIGPEVTQEKFLAGGMLCGKKYSDISLMLEPLGFKPLSVIS
mgnify:CR=1 FL=1